MSIVSPRASGCAVLNSQRAAGGVLSMTSRRSVPPPRPLAITAPVSNDQIGSHMRVTPLHDRLIIQRLEEGEQTIGSIIVPDSAKEKPQRGKVFAVGLGKVRDDGSRQPPDVKDGDTILFGKYSGQEIKIDGEEYLIMREDEVLAIIDSN
jgi:chaperonin GroES